MQSNLDYIKTIIIESTKRWLQTINLDRTSKFYGYADREYWAWKTKDFNNGTLQAGLAGFLDTKHLLDIEDEDTSYIIEACVIGSSNIQRSNGSFEEAYPYESSLCVTALVVFNLGYCYLKYQQYFSKRAGKILQMLLERALSYLEQNNETHGVISNHIATIELSILVARKILNKHMDFTRLDSFFNTQHRKEGWFIEYCGADPGYQTLLMHYCNVASDLLDLGRYQKHLQKSLSFIEKFIYQDGDFAGEVGARGTSIFYPSCLSIENQHSAIHWFLAKHSNRLETVNPITIDINNFVPVFNAWAYFYKHLSPQETILQKFQRPIFEYFTDSGFVFINYSSISAIISSNTGCIKLVKLVNDTWLDQSITAFFKDDYTTQGLPLTKFTIDDCNISFVYQYRIRKEPINTLFKNCLIRLISMTIYKIPILQRVLKKLLVKFVMQQNNTYVANIHAKLNMQESTFSIDIENPEKWSIAKCGFHGHMASANSFRRGYVS